MHNLEKLHFGRSFFLTKLNAMRQEGKTSDNDVAREDAFCGPKMGSNENSANERGYAFFSLQCLQHLNST